MPDAETWLLVDPVGDQAKPVSSRAFEHISAPKSRILARNCVALFLTPAGQVLHIETVEPKAQGMLTEARLWMGRAVPASFTLERVEISVEDMRTMIVDAATYMRLQPNPAPWWLMTAPLEEIRARLALADTLAALYQCIEFPKADASLELL